MTKDLFDYDVDLMIHGHLTQAEVVEELRLLADSMSTHKALADRIGISAAYLSDVLHGRREPGPAICRFLKLAPETIYKEARD